MANILVTYASQSGSTAGLADAIATTLRPMGTTVELQSMASVHDLTPYAAVVLGSAIRDKQWLPEAMHFVRTHQKDLAQKPAVVFTLCMKLAMRNGEQYRSEVVRWTAPIRALFSPVSEAHFARAQDISKIESRAARLSFRLSVLFRVRSEGDHRDCQAIRTWADQLYAQLVPVTV